MGRTDLRPEFGCSSRYWPGFIVDALAAISRCQVGLSRAPPADAGHTVGTQPSQAEMIAHSCVTPIARTRMTVTPMNSAVGICFR